MAINLRLNIQFLGSNRLVELASGLSSSQRSSQAWQPENGISCDSGQIQLISSLGKVSFLGDVSGSIEGTFLPQITKIIAGNVLLNDHFPAKFPREKGCKPEDEADLAGGSTETGSAKPRTAGTKLCLGTPPAYLATG